MSNVIPFSNKVLLEYSNSSSKKADVDLRSNLELYSLVYIFVKS